MPDIHLTDTGDLAISAGGDLAMVPNTWSHYAQQAYIRMMTAQGEYALYPALGANLERLYGLANTAETAAFGKQLIMSGLARENAFAGIPVDIKAVPISHHAIRFDVYITAAGRTDMVLSLVQNLVLDTSTGELISFEA